MSQPCAEIKQEPVGGKNFRNGEEGFTLMELIVVCVLIGMLLAFAVPSMNYSPFNDPLKASTRKIIGFVTGLRELAVRQQQPYLLHFNRAENRIWYEKDEEGEEDRLEDRQPKQLQFPDTVTIGEIWIGGEGSSIEDKDVVWVSKQGYMNHTVVQLLGKDGEKLHIQFHPFTDVATISDTFDTPLQGNQQ